MSNADVISNINYREMFKYHSSCSQLLAFIVESAAGKSVNEYTSEKLWKPMGAKHPALWNTDAKRGDEKALCCINSNARDFARLGKLYMNQGNWNGTQLLDSNYVKEATSVANLLDEDGNWYVFNKLENDSEVLLEELL